MNRLISIFALTLLVWAKPVNISVAVAQQQSQQVNIKALFYMLPEDAFFGMGEDSPSKFEKYITVCDIKNGFLRLELENEVRWEMCYWTMKNGDKLIGVSRSLSYDFYLYSNGKITNVRESEAVIEVGNGIGMSYANNCCDNTMEFYPPRYGTSIYLVFNGIDAQIYKWRNQRFVRLKEYPTETSTHQELFTGFAIALSAADADRCLQYIYPSYVVEQCMGVFEGKKEAFLCDLIGGQDEQGFVKPSKLNDIKSATYRLLGDKHTILIELKNGRSYTYYPSLDTIDIYEMLGPDETGDLERSIPYITSAAG